jgi:acyl carrier protein
MTTTIDRVRALFEEHAGPAALAEFGNDGSPWKTQAEVKSLGIGATDYLDSLDRAEFVMELEEEFGIDLPDSIAVHLTSLQDIADHLDVLLSGANASPH